MSTWTCACGFENRPALSRCQLCRTPRDEQPAPDDGKTAEEILFEGRLRLSEEYGLPVALSVHGLGRALTPAEAREMVADAERDLREEQQDREAERLESVE